MIIRSQDDIGNESICISGSNRNTDIGFDVNVPKGEIFILPRVEIRNVFIGFIKTGDGKLVFSDGCIIDGFGGDAFNCRGSNIEFINDGVLETYNCTPTRPYNKLNRNGNETVDECLERHNETVYDSSLLEFKDGYLWGYHCDALGQFYAAEDDGYTLDLDGTIENINIPRIRASHSGKVVQGLSCTEICEYKNFNLGTELLNVKLDYVYPFLFNQLSNSKIGNEKAKVSGKIRISDVKPTKFTSKNNAIVGIEVDGYMQEETIIQPLSLREWSENLKIEYEVILAVMMQESGAKTHRNGMPSILFECHVFDRSLKKNGFNPSDLVMRDNSLREIISYVPYNKYGSYRTQVKRFRKASAVDVNSAIMACSWGKFQVLGENYKDLGFESPKQFRDMVETEEGQIDVFMRYVETKKGLVKALQEKDWYRIKLLYQGSKTHDKDNDGTDDYVAGLIRNYTRIIQRKAPRKSILKSRTMRNNTLGGAIKLGAGEELIRNSGSIEDAINKIGEQADKIKELKGALTASMDKVKDVAADVAGVHDKLDSMSWVPYALGVVLIIALYPHLRVGYAYLQDNGYISVKGGIDDY